MQWLYVLPVPIPRSTDTASRLDKDNVFNGEATLDELHGCNDATHSST
jgi:hypothetical protein